VSEDVAGAAAGAARPFSAAAVAAAAAHLRASGGAWGGCPVGVHLVLGHGAASGACPLPSAHDSYAAAVPPVHPAAPAPTAAAAASTALPATASGAGVATALSGAGPTALARTTRRLPVACTAAGATAAAAAPDVRSGSSGEDAFFDTLVGLGASAGTTGAIMGMMTASATAALCGDSGDSSSDGKRDSEGGGGGGGGSGDITIAYAIMPAYLVTLALGSEEETLVRHAGPHAALPCVLPGTTVIVFF